MPATVSTAGFSPSPPVHERQMDEYASPISSDNDSDVANYQDLAVEASPDHDIDDDYDSPGAAAADNGRRRNGDPDASYFSDYAAEQQQQQHARRQEEDDNDDVCSRTLLPHLHHTGGPAETRPAARDAAVDESEADEFDDAEFSAVLDAHHAAAADVTRASPAGTFAAYSLDKTSGRRSQSWVDPLRALSTASSEDVASAAPPPRAFPQDDDAFFRRHYHGLSESTTRTSASRSQLRRDTLPYCGGPAPLPPPPQSSLLSPSPDPHREPTHEGPGEREMSERYAPRVTSSRASTLATIDAVHVMPCAPEAFHAPTAHAMGAAEHDSRPAPGTPTRAIMRRRDVADLHAHTAVPRGPDSLPTGPPAASLSFTAHFPNRRHLAVPSAPLSSINTTAASSWPVSRVVHARPPRGAPLLLQCTGHIPTSTRTVAIGAASDSDTDAQGDDATVTAGLHTSAYRESVDDATDMRTSCASSPARREDGPDVGNWRDRSRRGGRSPTRSGSPLFSTTDVCMDVSEADAAAACQRAWPPPPPRTASREMRYEEETEDEEEELSDLVDVSVQTEPIERSRQGGGRVVECDNDSDDDGASLVLCGYSVEALPVDQERRKSDVMAHFTRHALDRRSSSWTSSSDRGVGRSASGSSYLYKHMTDAEGSGQRLESVDTAHYAHVTHTAPPHSFTARPQHASGAPPRFDDVLESVEEIPSANSGDAPAVRVSPRSTALSHSHRQPQVRAPPSASVQWQRKKREAVHRLLEQQSRLTEPDRGMANAAHDDPHRVRLLDVDEVHMWATRTSSTDCIAAQEQKRVQRLTEEAERARLGLACDVCQAVRPHARDLLLVFLLLAEESHARLWRRHHRRGWGELSADVDTDTTGNGTGQYGDGGAACRVTFDVCAEAMNCVLERHGVYWVRATRELCRRIVRWCKQLQAGDSSIAAASARDVWGSRMTTTTPKSHRGSTEGDGEVEYATFVSCVLELAANFPDAVPAV